MLEILEKETFGHKTLLAGQLYFISLLAVVLQQIDYCSREEIQYYGKFTENLA